MIKSAKEFIELRLSNNPKKYLTSVNDSALDDVWNDLIENYPKMREWVALNKTVPLHILVKLASDSSSKVRFVVAQKRKITMELMHLLSNDVDESVRLAIAMNPNVDKTILKKMKTDSWEKIREVANQRLLTSSLTA